MGCLVAGAAIGAGHRFDGLLHRERSFFGVLRVIERGDGDGVQHQLASGSTIHGVQYTSPGFTTIPTSYYGRGTGLGLWLGQRAEGRGKRIGVIGLGVGTLSAYGRSGDRIRYYEIDPSVVRIARDDGFFTFLADTDADTEVILGDARISLEREQHEDERDRFDLLVLDAFNSDAIPIHLLTREAFEAYADALAPDGLLFVHTSNRHFDLMPLVARQGFEVGLESLYVESAHAPRLQSHRAFWVVLARDRGSLNTVTTQLRQRVHALGLPREHLALTRPLPGEVERIRVWTDDYSDLFGALRRK
jgi:spermidine synthase